MTMTYQEMEQALLNGVSSSTHYGEIYNGSIGVVIQQNVPGKWRVQFYHKDTRLLVLAEHMMESDEETLAFIYDVLTSMEGATPQVVEQIGRYTTRMLIVRENEEGTHEMEQVAIANWIEFTEINELLDRDSTVKLKLDGNAEQRYIQAKLEAYKIA